MKTLIIYNEITKDQYWLTVTNVQNKNIERLQNSGGFRRFGVTLYDEGNHLKAVKSPKSEIVETFTKPGMFRNKKLIQEYFK
jgi:hypothetical protein